MISYDRLAFLVKKLDFLDASFDDVRVVNYPLRQFFVYPKIIVLNVSDIFGYCYAFLEANKDVDMLEVEVVERMGWVRCRFLDQNTTALILPSLLSLDEAREYIKNLDVFESINFFLKKKLKKRGIKIKYTLQGVLYETSQNVCFRRIKFEKLSFWRRFLVVKPTGKISRFLVWGH